MWGRKDADGCLSLLICVAALGTVGWKMTIEGYRFVQSALTEEEQQVLLEAIEKALETAPYFVPRMPRTGQPFSVRMTNFGPLGWVSDKAGGYRYQKTHPETGASWPRIPELLLNLWREFAAFDAEPEACLVNFYGAGTKMGSHRDVDEQELRAPVLSVSLGDDAVFHVGGLKRGDPKERVVLRSGDVVVLGGAARKAFHGIDRVIAGSSDLVPGGGRINLTMRRVTKVL